MTDVPETAITASPECVFCKRIKAREYDYEDPWSVAFQPLLPVTPGHFLVVPRKHVSHALESPGSAGKALELAGYLANQMGLQAANFITSAGLAATQSVFHLHIHIVPRADGDGLVLPWTHQMAELRKLPGVMLGSTPGQAMNDDVPDTAITAAFELWSELADCAGVWPPSPQTAFRAGWTAAVPHVTAAERERWSRDAIIAKLAARFGPHKAYVSATRSYEPDGNDAEGSCMISEPHEYEEIWLHLCGDGPCDCQPVKRIETQLRPLTYGEIADLLTGAT